MDDLAVEEPLQLRLNGEEVAVLMRTPGDDEDLAWGFAITEGLVADPADIAGVKRVPRPDGAPHPHDLDIQATPRHRDALQAARRALFASTSCGLCGKTTVAAIHLQAEPFLSPLHLDPAWLLTLPSLLRSRQANFARTGGLHAAALFRLASDPLFLLREDVGRHNACDKVLGAASRAWGRGQGTPPPPLGALLLVSGRISFEVVQKAWLAGVPAVAGLSAPTSLAVDLAQSAGMTLVGFLAQSRLNLYAGSLSGG